MNKLMNRNSRHALLHLQRARYYVKKATNQKNHLQFGVMSDAELEQVLEKLEQFSIEDKKIDDIDEQYMCPICLSTKADDSPEKRWIVSKDCECKRPFHADCLAVWLAKYKTCPRCRSELPEQKPVPTQTTVTLSQARDSPTFRNWFITINTTHTEKYYTPSSTRYIFRGLVVDSDIVYEEGCLIRFECEVRRRSLQGVWKIHLVKGRNNIALIVNQRPLQLIAFSPITSDISGQDLATAVELKHEETGQ